MNNAVLEPGDNLVGHVRRYSCLPGYMATGPVETTCALPKNVEQGQRALPDWSTPVHFCKGLLHIFFMGLINVHLGLTAIQHNYFLFPILLLPLLIDVSQMPVLFNPVYAGKLNCTPLYDRVPKRLYVISM